MYSEDSFVKPSLLKKTIIQPIAGDPYGLLRTVAEVMNKQASSSDLSSSTDNKPLVKSVTPAFEIIDTNLSQENEQLAQRTYIPFLTQQTMAHVNDAIEITTSQHLTPVNVPVNHVQIPST